MIDEDFFLNLFNHFFKENEGYKYFDLSDNKELYHFPSLNKIITKYF